MVANEAKLGNNTSREAEAYVPINENDVEEFQHDHRESIEEVIVISSSDYDELESSLTPAPSTIVSDPFDQSYSPRSPSSDGRNMSVDPNILDDEFDLSDFNAPPEPPSTSSEGVDSSNSDEGQHKAVDDRSCTGPGGSTSAVEALRAIQTELIPGYEDGYARNERSTGDAAQSELPLLFPGLPTHHMREEHTAE